MKKINPLAVILLLFVAGCVGSKITSSWKAPEV
jgi:hypothetical protein